MIIAPLMAAIAFAATPAAAAGAQVAPAAHAEHQQLRAQQPSTQHSATSPGMSKTHGKTDANCRCCCSGATMDKHGANHDTPAPAEKPEHRHKKR